jgi:hypothetical protein
VVEAAFAKLQQESFKIFFSNLMEIKEQAGRITFKTAADIAAQMVIGQTKDIFAKIDPLTVGEDYRSNLIAEQYAIRLNLKANNLVQSSRVDGLDILLRGYPSHGFVIDRQEASQLFHHVSAPAGKVAELAQILGSDVIIPRHAVHKGTAEAGVSQCRKHANRKSQKFGQGRWAARFKQKSSRGRF